MSRHSPSKTRVVGYTFEGAFDEEAAERVLAKAEKAGIVSQYDTGRGSVVWFNGPPGAELRAVRDEVKALISKTPVQPIPKEDE